MLKTLFQKVHFLCCNLVNSERIFFFEIEVPEVALLGIGRNFSCVPGARREGSYSWIMGGDVENVFLSVLASLGLNTYLRDKGGEAGTVRGADLRIEFCLNFSKQTDRSAFLIDVFCFRRKKSHCVPSFSFICFDTYEISDFWVLSWFYIGFLLKIHSKIVIQSELFSKALDWYLAEAPIWTFGHWFLFCF